MWFWRSTRQFAADLLRNGPARGLLVALPLLAGCGVVGGGAQPGPVMDQPLANVPAEALGRWQRATAQRADGQTDAARAGFEALTRDYPQYAGPWLNLAIIHQDAGDPEQARQLLGIAAERCVDCAPVFNELGVLERQQGNFAAAEAAYLRAIAANADYALPWFNLGVLYELYRQQPAKAANHYERYLELAVDLDGEQEIRAWVADLRRRAGVLSQAGES